MLIFDIVSLVLLTLSEGASDPATRSLPVHQGCDLLKQDFPNKVFYAGEAVYEWEKQAFWSNTQILSPSCIFRP
ncbi:hypothetical protein MFIFM68171_05508 [Madurella fahalii]|uniref:Amine oxidase domain-containing protein n=1 Tax=Madurella fahalii TaxID=1157608 RepID=A0ABQ0GC05_9PEZI